MIGSLKFAIEEDRAWMLDVHSRHPEEILPKGFGNRDFDNLMKIFDIIPEAHPKSASIKRDADTSTPFDKKEENGDHPK